MPCYYPLNAWRLACGSVVFVERGDVVKSLQLPCGRCHGCRLERSRQWAVRCMHEAKMHEHNCFVTLTYDDAHLPEDGSLNHEHFQKFMRRLRKSYGKVRFYMAGEYGEQLNRPHYHACLFGVRFDDMRYHMKTDSGSMIYTSEVLSKLWPHGFSSIGELTFESAAYTARYVMKKMTGPGSDAHYEDLNLETGEIYKRLPEYNKMSLKPGIGATWFEKFKTDVYPHDHVIVNATEAKPPRYYDKLLKRCDSATFDDIQYRRELDGRKLSADNTPERLQVKEKVSLARTSLSKRKL